MLENRPIWSDLCEKISYLRKKRKQEEIIRQLSISIVFVLVHLIYIIRTINLKQTSQFAANL